MHFAPGAQVGSGTHVGFGDGGQRTVPGAKSNAQAGFASRHAGRGVQGFAVGRDTGPSTLTQSTAMLSTGLTPLENTTRILSRFIAPASGKFTVYVCIIPSAVPRMVNGFSKSSLYKRL